MCTVTLQLCDFAWVSDGHQDCLLSRDPLEATLARWLSQEAFLPHPCAGLSLPVSLRAWLLQGWFLSCQRVLHCEAPAWDGGEHWLLCAELQDSPLSLGQAWQMEHDGL